MDDDQRRCTARIAQGIKDVVTKYETTRSVTFRTPSVALCHRSIQGLVLLYIVVYVFIWEKGYQIREIGESSVVSKVKGNQRGTFHAAHGLRYLKTGGGMTWDPADVVVPPLENNALFITTKVTITPQQTQSQCAESDDMNAECSTSADCVIGNSPQTGHGPFTGVCNKTRGVCEVYAWCPVEDDLKQPIHLTGGSDLTILVKNFILFPKLKIRRRNFGESAELYIRNCLYDAHTDPLCPAFSLGKIIAEAKEDYHQMAGSGAILSFAITWNCDLDFHIRHCLPKYSFRRLDDEQDLFFPGWNFRSSGYWLQNNEQHRYVIKHTGIRIVFNVYAVAGKFNFVQFTLNLGSGLGLLGMATLLCDYLLFYCSKPYNREFRARFAALMGPDYEKVDQGTFV